MYMYKIYLNYVDYMYELMKLSLWFLPVHNVVVLFHAVDYMCKEYMYIHIHVCSCARVNEFLCGFTGILVKHVVY